MSMFQQYPIIAITAGTFQVESPPDWLWCILTAVPEDAIMREIQLHRPRVLVVDLTAHADIWLELAATLIWMASEVQIIAVGAPNRPDLELLSRRVGIRCYLPTWRGLESAVALLQPGRGRM